MVDCVKNLFRLFVYASHIPIWRGKLNPKFVKQASFWCIPSKHMGLCSSQDDVTTIQVFCHLCKLLSHTLYTWGWSCDERILLTEPYTPQLLLALEEALGVAAISIAYWWIKSQICRNGNWMHTDRYRKVSFSK